MTQPEPARPAAEPQLGAGPRDRLRLWLRFALGYAGASVLLVVVWWWLAGAVGLPAPPVVADLPTSPWLLGLVAVTGALLGAAAATDRVRRLAAVTVDIAAVELRAHQLVQTVARTSVDAVYLDGADLVLAAADGAELARAAAGPARERAAQVFLDHGWPWHEAPLAPQP